LNVRSVGTSERRKSRFGQRIFAIEVMDTDFAGNQHLRFKQGSSEFGTSRRISRRSCEELV
jgi:hypothetical protein